MNNWDKVEKTEESVETKQIAHKAKNSKLIRNTTIAGLVIFIIAAVATDKTINSKYQKDTNSAYEISLDDTQNIEASNVVESVSNFNDSTSVTTNNTNTFEIDYTGATNFYNELNNKRKTNKHYFEDIFKTEQDVKDYVDFLCYFDTNYEVERPTTIKNLDDFLAITDSYYNDCAEYKIKPTLNKLINNNTYIQNKVKTVEELANNLQNTSGQDYSIANKYYSELANDLCTTSGINISNVVNCPGCEIIISICKNYNHVGNAYQARQNEKTVNLKDMSNTLNIKNVDDEYLCPDSTYKSIVNQIKNTIDEQIINNYDNLERTK